MLVLTVYYYDTLLLCRFLGGEDRDGWLHRAEHKAADCALPHPSLVLAGSGTELGLAVQVAEKIHSADPRYPTHYIYTQQ